MGHPKQKWTRQEEEALRAGVNRYGTGKWKAILDDPEFRTALASRSNIDLKDKWRNIGMSASSQESRDRVKTTKSKNHPLILPPNLEIPFPLATEQNPSIGMAVDPLQTLSYGKSASPFVNPFPLATEQNPFIGMAVDPLKTPSYGRSASWYNAQTCEALSTMNKPNGSETNSGMGYIEVGNCYNIIKHGVPGQNPSFVEKQNEEYCQKQLQVCAVKAVGVEIQAAAKAAACKLAIAEQADGQAISVAEKANKAADLADHSDSVLQLAEYIFNKCYHGDVVLLI